MLFPYPQSRSDEVVIFIRRPSETQRSIEQVLDRLVPEIGKRRPTKLLVCPYHSTGILKIVGNLLFVFRNRGATNHVFGDIHYVMAALLGTRSLLTVLDCVWFQNRKSKIAKVLFRIVYAQLAGLLASRIVTISKQTAVEFAELSGVSINRLSVIPCPVRPEFVCPPAYRTRAKVHNVLVVGTSWNKNISRILSAVSGLEITLHVVGRLSAEFTATANSLGLKLSNYVDLTTSGLADLYRRCDCLLFPSVYEGQGLPIIEGQAAGLLIVTSDRQPMKDLAGPSAFLAAPEDHGSIRSAVRAAIDCGEAEAEGRRKVGRENASRFTVEAVAAAYNREYELILYNEVNTRSY